MFICKERMEKGELRKKENGEGIERQKEQEGGIPGNGGRKEEGKKRERREKGKQ